MQTTWTVARGSRVIAVDLTSKAQVDRLIRQHPGSCAYPTPTPRSTES